MGTDQRRDRDGRLPHDTARRAARHPGQRLDFQSDQQDCACNYRLGSQGTDRNRELPPHERRTEIANRSPHAARLAARSARRWHQLKDRRAWRRHGPMRPAEYLILARWYTGVCLIAAALIVACDRWPVFA